MEGENIKEYKNLDRLVIPASLMVEIGKLFWRKSSFRKHSCIGFASS
jgi:hypothetical protein